MALGLPLPQAEQIGQENELLELLVLQGSDQGTRRAGRVARLYHVGEKRAIAQLIDPQMFWLRNGKMVLTGTEEVIASGVKAAFVQSWICRLRMPPRGRFKAAMRFHCGVEQPRRMLNDRHGHSCSGDISVAAVDDRVLGRSSIQALIGVRDASTSYGRSGLVDCRLEWIGEDRFELAGFERQAEQEGRVSALWHQAWICSLEISPEEVEGKPLRNAKPQQ